MQIAARSMPPNDLPELPARAFEKADAAPDRQFYAIPRFVTTSTITRSPR